MSEKIGVTWDIEDIPCGGQYYLEHGDLDWPDGSQQKCADADLILLGAVGWPDPEGNGAPVLMSDGKMAGFSPVIGNRINLNLYANVRPIKLYKGVSHRMHGGNKVVWEHDKVDMVIIRENTEDLYAPTGGKLSPGGQAQVAIDTRVITRRASEQVIRFAFELCRKRKQGRAQGRQEARHRDHQGQRPARLPALPRRLLRNRRGVPRHREGHRHRRRLHPVADRPARVLRRVRHHQHVR